jgi:hypothetical protein
VSVWEQTRGGFRKPDFGKLWGNKGRVAKFTEAVADRQLTDDEWQFAKAVDVFKRLRNRPRPTWADVLAVAKSLGWRRVAEVGRASAQRDD